jgi:hypothetical protein
MAADFTLSDGREITFDLDVISVKEWRALLNPSQPDAEEDATIAKVAGLKAEDIESLSYREWRRLAKAFFAKASDPHLTDPN